MNHQTASENSSPDEIILNQEELDFMPFEQLEKLAYDLDIPVGDLRQPKDASKRSKIPYDGEKLAKFMEEEALKSRIGENYIVYHKKTNPQVLCEKSEENLQKKKALASEKIDNSEIQQEINLCNEDEILQLIEELEISSLINSQGNSLPDKKTTIQATKYPTFPDDGLNTPNLNLLLSSLSDPENCPTEINLNNCQEITLAYFSQLVNAILINQRVEKLFLSNIAATDSFVNSLAFLLKNSKSLINLNLETNRFSGAAILCLLQSVNPILQEFRISNQFFSIGTGIEVEIAQEMKKNHHLTTFSADIRDVSSRLSVFESLKRNVDQKRQEKIIPNEKK